MPVEPGVSHEANLGVRPRPGPGRAWRATTNPGTAVEPKEPLPGRPWAWRGEFFGAFPNADVELLRRGWHLACIGVPNRFGAPAAMRQ
jgi:hypothetical protein